MIGLKSQSQKGVILAAVLVTLVAVMLVGASLTRLVVLNRRELGRAEQRRQVFWLAESAVIRARAAIREKADYPGETWRMRIESAQPLEAETIIRVIPNAESQQRTVQIEAQVTRSSSVSSSYREFSFTFPTSGENP